MATSTERYRKHKVWETLAIKREALNAARYDSEALERHRVDVVEWLDEATLTRLTRRPALYLSALDDLQAAVNDLGTDTAAFQAYMVGNRSYGQNPRRDQLLSALKALPLPPPKDLAASYVKLLDKEVEERTARLDALEESIAKTQTSLAERRDQLQELQQVISELKAESESSRESIADVTSTATQAIEDEWQTALASWKEERAKSDLDHNAEALEQISLLGATAAAGAALAEHAAGDLSAADWGDRTKRERRAAQWLRAGAGLALLVAGAIGWYIVAEALRNSFDLTVGDGILRSSVVVVVGAFGGLLLRESNRHFREADTAEDVRLSLVALAPFYANAHEEVRLAARVQVGNAVLVQNVLSRFAHRDAAKHGEPIDTAALPDLIAEATKLFKTSDTSAAPRDTKP